MRDNACCVTPEHVAGGRIKAHLPGKDLTKTAQGFDEPFAVPYARPGKERRIEESVGLDETVGEFAVVSKKKEVRKPAPLTEQSPEKDAGSLKHAHHRQPYAHEVVGLAGDRDLPLLQFAVLPHDGPRRPPYLERRKWSFVRMEQERSSELSGEFEPEQPDIPEQMDIALAVTSAAGGDPVPLVRLEKSATLVRLRRVHAVHIPFSFG